MKHTSIRLVALASAVTLLLTLAACGAKPEDVAGKVEPGPSATAPVGTVETTPPASEDETGDEEENPVSLGRMEGGVYTNSYAGFGCELDSNWEFYTAEELQEMPENVGGLFGETELGESIASLSQVMDMQAENANDLTSVNVLYIKLDTQTRLAFALLSEEETIDAMFETKDKLIGSYTDAGVEIESMEKVEIDFLGEKHFAVHTSANLSGIPIYLLQVIDYHAGRYGITTTFASYLEDKTQEVADLFYKVD